jgi:flagellar motor switch/type III secretory pathway protein FliN
MEPTSDPPARIAPGADPPRTALLPAAALQANSKDSVAGIPLEFRVQLAERRFAVEKLLDLRPGAVLEFPQGPDRPLGAFVGKAPIGEGRAVDIGERLGFRIDTVDPAALVPGAGPARAEAARSAAEDASSPSPER